MLASLLPNQNLILIIKYINMMPLFFQKPLLLGCLLAVISPIELFAQDVELGTLPPPRKLTESQTKVASANYQKYCSLCHGADRQGHVNDHAPSLRSKSLFESGVPHAILRPMSYGRRGTAMGGYLDEVGGPMALDETWD